MLFLLTVTYIFVNHFTTFWTGSKCKEEFYKRIKYDGGFRRDEPTSSWQTQSYTLAWKSVREPSLWASQYRENTRCKTFSVKVRLKVNSDRILMKESSQNKCFKLFFSRPEGEYLWGIKMHHSWHWVSFPFTVSGSAKEPHVWSVFCSPALCSLLTHEGAGAANEAEEATFRWESSTFTATKWRREEEVQSRSVTSF